MLYRLSFSAAATMVSVSKFGLLRVQLRAPYRGRDDPGVVQEHCDVGVSDVFLLSEAALDVEQVVVGVREISSLLDLNLELSVQEVAFPESERLPATLGLGGSTVRGSTPGAGHRRPRNDNISCIA